MARFKTPKARRIARERAYNHPRKRSAGSPGERYQTPKRKRLLAAAIARAEAAGLQDTARE